MKFHRYISQWCTKSMSEIKRKHRQLEWNEFVLNFGKSASGYSLWNNFANISFRFWIHFNFPNFLFLILFSFFPYVFFFFLILYALLRSIYLSYKSHLWRIIKSVFCRWTKKLHPKMNKKKEKNAPKCEPNQRNSAISI